MNLVAVVINGLVVSAVGIVLAWLGHGRFAALESRMDRLEGRFVGGEGRLDGRMDRLEDRLGGRIDALQASVDGMRSDLTAVALAVGARPRTGQDGSARSSSERSPAPAADALTPPVLPDFAFDLSTILE